MPAHMVGERRQDPENIQRDWWHFRSVLEQRRQQDCSLFLQQHCMCHGFQDVVKPDVIGDEDRYVLPMGMWEEWNC